MIKRFKLKKDKCNCGGHCGCGCGGNCNGNCKCKSEEPTPPMIPIDIPAPTVEECCNPIANLNPTPAVLFDYSVYSIGENDGLSCTSIPSDIYNRLVGSSSNCTDKAILRAFDNNGNFSVEENIIRDGLYNSVDIIVSKFDATLNNCLLAHMNNLTALFTTNEYSFINFTEPNPSFSNIFRSHAFDIGNTLYKFSTSLMNKEECMEMINSGSLYNTVLLWVNDFGNNIYNFIRFKVNEFVSACQFPNNEAIAEIFNNVDIEFCRMMQDFVYETSVLIHDLSVYAEEYAIPKEVSDDIRKNAIEERKALRDNNRAEYEPF